MIRILIANHTIRDFHHHRWSPLRECLKHNVQTDCLQ